MSSLRVIALSKDLMDQSKLRGNLDGVEIVRSVDALIDKLSADSSDGAEIAIVDLRLVDDVDQLGALANRVIAFGSHVDEAVLAAAEAAGVEALPRSRFFRRLGDGSLI